MTRDPEPVRRFAQPEPGDDWRSLAARFLAREPEARAVAMLQRWNPHLVLRPPTVPLTPLDIVFLEPPAV